jgi:membrane-associated protease RseP (regulator of RpoE activity)
MKRFVFAGLFFAALETTASAAAPAAPPPPAAPTPPATHTMQWSFEIGQGRLGAQVSSMTPELRAFFGAPNDAGILVQKIEKDSVADKAGMNVGDVLVEVDGDRVEGMGDVREALADRKKGDSVELVVIRGKKRRTLSAQIDDDPGPAGFAFPPGVHFSPGSGVDFDLRGFGMPPDVDDRLRRLEERLDALDGGTPPPKRTWGKSNPAPKVKPKPKAKPTPGRRGA